MRQSECLRREEETITYRAARLRTWGLCCTSIGRLLPGPILPPCPSMCTSCLRELCLRIFGRRRRSWMAGATPEASTVLLRETLWRSRGDGQWKRDEWRQE